MKKRLIAVILISAAILLSGCGQEAYENAAIAVDGYNAAAEEYNSGVDVYNDSIDEVLQANAPFDEVIAFAEELINSEAIPFDESTKVTLIQELETAKNLRIDPPERIQHIELMTVSDKAKRSELDAIKADAETGRSYILSLPIPQKISLPEYGSAIATLNDAIAAYSNSIESMNQITAPSDDFVIERLREIDTIVDIAPVTEDHDPNGNLGKQGGYIGCIYFSDSRIDKSKLYIAPGEDNVIDIGTDGGGAIEIYDSSEFAKRRDEYLASFDGTGFTSGSHYVYGTLVIRTSNEFTGSQQRELTDQIVVALTRVKGEELQEAEPGSTEID